VAPIEDFKNSLAQENLEAAKQPDSATTSEKANQEQKNQLD